MNFLNSKFLIKNKKIKLLIFAPFFPPHKGGLETHIKEFIERLPKENFEVLVFTPFIPKNIKTKKFDEEFMKENKNIKILRYDAFELVHHFPIPKFWKSSFWKKIKEIFDFNPDIIESHTRFFFSSLMALIFSKVIKKPLIHFDHGSEFIRVNNKFLNPLVLFWDKFFGKLVLKKADKVVAISKAVEEFLIKKMKISKERIILSYRGIDLEKLKKVECKKEIKDRFKNKIIIGFVGRLINWKGVNNTIKAVKNLPKEIKDKVVLIIIGDGPERKNLELLAGKELNKTIFFLGQKDFLEAKQIQKCFDIYIHSSYPGGGLSTSLLEAMALGNAIIASPHEGAKEVIINNKTGILLNSNKPEEIKKALIELIKNEKLREELSKNAKKFVEENFNWDKRIKERIKIMLSLLNNKD